MSPEPIATGYVYVVRDPDIFADGELYVFTDSDTAEAFARARFGSVEGYVLDEPLLGREMVEAAKEEHHET